MTNHLIYLTAEGRQAAEEAEGGRGQDEGNGRVTLLQASRAYVTGVVAFLEGLGAVDRRQAVMLSEVGGRCPFPPVFEGLRVSYRREEGRGDMTNNHRVLCRVPNVTGFTNVVNVPLPIDNLVELVNGGGALLT